MEKEFDTVLKTTKLAVLMKYFLKNGKERNLVMYFFDYVTRGINKTQQRYGGKTASPTTFPKKSHLGITKNYKDISLTSIAA